MAVNLALRGKAILAIDPILLLRNQSPLPCCFLVASDPDPAAESAPRHGRNLLRNHPAGFHVFQTDNQLPKQKRFRKGARRSVHFIFVCLRRCQTPSRVCHAHECHR